MSNRRYYFDRTGNIVNGKRQFAGLVMYKLNKGKAKILPLVDPDTGVANFTKGQVKSAQNWAESEQAKLRDAGEEKHERKVVDHTARKLKGGATLFTGSKASGSRRGGSGGGPKRPKMTCKRDGANFICYGKGDARLGTISVKVDGYRIAKSDYKDGSVSRGDRLPVYAYKATGGTWVSKLRTAKKQLGDAKGYRI